MSGIIIAPKETVEKLEVEGEELVREAKELTIISQATYEACAELARTAKAFQREVEKVWKEPVESAHRAHKAALAAKKKQLDPYKTVERICKTAMAEWDREQRRLAEERARKAEEERLRLAAEAEEKGNVAEVDIILNAPATIVEAPERPSGVVYVDNCKAAVVDLDAVPREYLVPDMQMLNRLAKASKGKNPPTGVRYYNDRTTRII